MAHCPPTKVKFQLRRDNTCDWIAVNPVLQLGEPGFESDTYKLKIGDGVTPWNCLPYIGGETMVFNGGGPANIFVNEPAFDCGGVLPVAMGPMCCPTGPVAKCGTCDTTICGNTGCTGYGGSTGPSCRSC